jgi:peroxiredoxin
MIDTSTNRNTMKISNVTLALNFTAQSLEGKEFKLSDFKGQKILLSFFRNSACALCNLRIHELIASHDKFVDAGIKVVAVFETSAEDMKPYVAQQEPPFILVPDPQARLYDLYHVESSQEKVAAVVSGTVAHTRIAEAAAKGFQLIQQDGSNFFRLPADFLIDENFNIVKWHYSDQIIDHLSIEEVLAY